MLSASSRKMAREVCTRLLREHANEIEQQEYLEREAWFVLRARRPGVSVRELARQYGLEELRDYIDRSRRDIDAMRGWSFSQKTDQTVSESRSEDIRRR